MRMQRHAINILLLCLLACVAWDAEARAASLQQKFNDAYADFHSLSSDKRKGQYRSHWLDIEKQFLGIFKADPTGSLAPKSLYYVGRIYEELGERSRLKSDFEAACDYFQRVVSRFPSHPWADDCLYRKAVINQRHLGHPDRAYADLLTIERKHKSGDMRAKAAAMLRELDAAGAGKAKEVPPAPEAAAVKPSVMPAKAAPTPSGPVILDAVRYQSSDDYTRVVFDLSGEARFKWQLLDPAKDAGRPQRLYVDLIGVQLSQEATKDLSVSDGILKQIRTGQNAPDTARVVLDFNAFQDYKIFQLYDPYRVVVDVYAPRKGQSDKTMTASASGESTHPTEAEAAAATPANGAPHDEPSATPDASTGKSAKGKHAPSKMESSVPPVAVAAEPVAVTSSRPGKASVDKAKGLSPNKAQRKHSESLIEQLGLTVETIMLDPGHGGKDVGATANGLYEKDVVLRAAKILGAKLEAKGFRVLYTRTTDKFIPLEERTAMANVRKADLFISLHCNAEEGSSASGLEVYSLNLAKTKDAVRVAARENAVTARRISDLQVILTDLMLNSKVKESKDLAGDVQGHILRSVRGKHDLRDRKQREAPFYVLMGAKMPAILVEMGYITNPAEARRLDSEAFLDDLCDGIVAGIGTYKKAIERYASR